MRGPLLLLLPALGCGTSGAAERLPGPGDETLVCGDDQLQVGPLCVSAGVEECLVGEPNGLGGCISTLPRCAPGEMILPGWRACAPVGDCGSGRWGAIALEEDTVFVDGSFTGTGEGTADKPYKTVQGAVAFAPDGAHIAVAEGQYPGEVSVSGKTLRIEGRCPALVSLVGSSNDLSTSLQVTDSANLEVSNLALTGAGFGVGGSDATIALRRVWIHDTGRPGIAALDLYGAMTVIVEDSLFEHNGQTGIWLSGTRGVIRGTEIRDGVASDLLLAPAVRLSPGVTGPAEATLEDVYVHGAVGVGVVAVNGEINIDRAVVSDTAPVSELLEDGYGVLVADQRAQNGATWPARAQIRNTIVQRAHEAGVFLLDASSELDNVTIIDTRPQLVDGGGGTGLSLRRSLEAPMMVTMRRGFVGSSHAFGIFVADAEVELDGLVVRDTRAQPGDDLFGDGIAAVGYEQAPSITIRGSLVAGSERAGISSFGGVVTAGGNVISCNAFDLVGEQGPVGDHEFVDRGQNRCVCGESDEICRAASASLGAPDPP